MTRFTGNIAGYDPGGNGSHGFALAQFMDGQCHSLCIKTLQDANAVIEALRAASALAALGVDTLAAWSTGDSGWRPSDRWLRNRYSDVRSSVVSPNSLQGSMGLNGMAVLIAVRQTYPRIAVTETHPKVLYRAIAGTKYDYAGDREAMNGKLSEWLGCPVVTNNDHEWDAVVSVLAALKGLQAEWTHDLFTESGGTGPGPLLFPAGHANFWWPD